MSAVTQFIRNVAYQSASDLFLRIVSAVTGIVVIRFLAKDDYGLLALILAIVGFVNLVSNLGYPTMVVKSISQHYANEPGKANAAYLFTRNVYAVITVVFAALIIIAAPFIARAYDQPQAAALLRIGSLLFLLMSLYSFFNWTFVGLNEIKPFFLKAGIPKELITLAAVALLLHAGFGIEGVLFAQIMGLAAALIIAEALVGSRLKGKGGEIDRRGIVRGALEIAPSSLAYASTVYMDIIVIGALLAVSSVASYRVCLAVVQMAAGFFPVGAFVLPMLGRVGKDRAKKVVGDIVRGTIVLAMPAMIFVASFSREIIIMLFGAKYGDSAPLLTLFSFVLAAQLAGGIFVGTINYLGKFRALSAIWAAMAVVNVALLYLLTGRFGLAGAVWATLALHYALCILMGVYVARQGMAVKWARLFEVVVLGSPLVANLFVMNRLAVLPKMGVFAATVVVYALLLKARGVFGGFSTLKEVHYETTR